jgi:isopenicillin N synthase-like dioxygenase
VKIDGEWRPVQVAARGSAHIIFGRCTEIRSNGRISACFHRVADNTPSSSLIVPRRLSAVLFVAPNYKCTRLDPVVREGEMKKFDSVAAIELSGHRLGNRTRQWKTRDEAITNITKENKLKEEK